MDVGDSATVRCLKALSLVVTKENKEKSTSHLVIRRRFGTRNDRTQIMTVTLEYKVNP